MENSNKNFINITGSIEVRQKPATVFQYVSDLRLDKHWRKEVNETTVSEPELKAGVIAIEDSFLSRRVPNYKAALQCVALQPGRSVVYQSLPENPFWLKSSREVTTLSGNSARVIYQLEFDPAVVKHGLGFQLPSFFLKFYTKATLNKYLRNLKQVLEDSTTNK